MKIKKTVTVTKRVDVDVEISTPYFCKSENGRVFYKIINEQGNFITVTTYDFSKGVDFQRDLNEYVVLRDSNVEITEEEFNKVLNEVLDFLRK